LVIFALVGGLGGIHVLKSMGLTSVDRSDYKDVAISFCKDSGRIARELGKLKSVKSLGAGRGAKKTAYCSLSVRGEDGRGNIHVSLFQDDKSDWYIKSATLMTGGKELSIPVSRSDEKRAIKVFGDGG